VSLKVFDPWRGQFADWKQKALGDAPCFRRSLEVLFLYELFYMNWPALVTTANLVMYTWPLGMTNSARKMFRWSGMAQRLGDGLRQRLRGRRSLSRRSPANDALNDIS
jgi:hypothetical protein